jgi:hypothetical protein
MAGPAGPAASQCAHLGSFVRRAGAAQQAAFWREVGETVARSLAARGEAPTWVSTEGSGVAWLHVRLDARPKYYHHAPYRAFAAPAALQRREQREEAAAVVQRRRRGAVRAD